MREKDLKKWLVKVCMVYDSYTSKDFSIFYEDEFSDIEALIDGSDGIDDIDDEMHFKVTRKWIENTFQQMLIVWKSQATYDDMIDFVVNAFKQAGVNVYEK